MANQKNKWKRWHKVLIGILLSFFLLILIIGVIAINSKVDPKEDALIKKMADSAMIADTSSISPAAAQIDNVNWEYESEPNEMDNDTTLYAKTTSLNLIDQAMPYEATNGIITIRKMHNKNEVIFSINSGQLLAGVTDDRVARIKFDNDKPISVGYRGTSDYRSDVVFFDSPSLLVSKLKKAQKVIVQIEIYQAGAPQFTFDVEGLKWK
jgi:hypothetical protein